jgi:hypothetical protein
MTKLEKINEKISTLLEGKKRSDEAYKAAVEAKLKQDVIKRYFNKETAKKEDLIKELERSHVTKDEMEEIVINHHFLAISNIRKSQLLFAGMVITVLLAMTVVRYRLTIPTFLVLVACGVLLALPYILLYYLMKRAEGNLKSIKLLSGTSFVYTLVLGIVFIVITLQMNASLIVVLPVLVWGAYIAEIIKLNKLISEIGEEVNVSKGK